MLLDFSVVPLWYWYILFFILGTIIGSFLNVYLYRFHTGRSLGGDSHCLSCHVNLTWYDLVPLLSYVVLTARCRSCGAYIPPRYFVVELLTGASFLGVFAFAGWSLHLAPLLAVAVLLILITVYDYYHLIIPDEFVLALAALAAIIVGLEWWQDVFTLTEVAYTAGAALAASSFLAGLWYVSNGRWIGLGDAKLALPLALLVGYAGALSLFVFSFWIGAVVSLALLAVGHLAARVRYSRSGVVKNLKLLTMKSEVPFAPFLILSFLFVYFLGSNVVALFSYAL